MGGYQLADIDEAIEHAKEMASKNRILAESDDLVRNSYSVGLKEKQCLLCAEEHEQLVEWLEELKEYRKKANKFPCKVGDTVYKTISSTKIVEIKIESIFITANGINISGRETKTKCSVCISLSDFGKTVFFTKDRKSQ